MVISQGEDVKVLDTDSSRFNMDEMSIGPRFDSTFSRNPPNLILCDDVWT